MKKLNKKTIHVTLLMYNWVKAIITFSCCYLLITYAKLLSKTVESLKILMNSFKVTILEVQAGFFLSTFRQVRTSLLNGGPIEGPSQTLCIMLPITMMYQGFRESLIGPHEAERR